LNTAARTSDGTRPLLQWGSLVLGIGLVAGLLVCTVLGGFTANGAHSNAGWFAAILALSCTPCGLLIAGLGAAKWMRNRRLSR
jgi:hypothetical protein